MLRRASRSLFVARNRTLLVESARALGKGATNPTIVGSNKQAAQNVDPAGQAPLEFGKHSNESSMFASAAAAWDTMRKVGQTNPIETNIEKFEERYQTEGTGAEPIQKQKSQSGPGLWERAKEAVQAVKESITPAGTQSSQASGKQYQDITFADTQSEQQISEKTLAEQMPNADQLRQKRPGFADDATGHRPWNWDMAQDSLRNSTDGMGIIEPVGPTAADYEARRNEWNNTQVNDNLKAQKQEFSQGTKQDNTWQNTKQAANENWQNTKQAAKENWQDTKATASENWQDIKAAANENVQDAKAAANENWQDAKAAVNENWQDAKQKVKEN